MDSSLLFLLFSAGITPLLFLWGMLHCYLVPVKDGTSHQPCGGYLPDLPFLICSACSVFWKYYHVSFHGKDHIFTFGHIQNFVLLPAFVGYTAPLLQSVEDGSLPFCSFVNNALPLVQLVIFGSA